MTNAGGGLGVYIHWPYCARICPYCDFNVYKNRELDAGRWAKALSRDLGHWAGITQNKKVSSLYFGGGTPSLAPVEIISAVVHSCDELWGFEENAEITLEANPTDTERGKLSDLKKAGINRLSLGIQSLCNDALKFLGRDHGSADARKAINAAQEIFPRVNIDLIYARPGQTAAQWKDELQDALSFGITHFSLYQLTIEPGTAFAIAVDNERWRAAKETACAEQFELTQEIMDGAGMPAYEISNHAAPEAQSRHNLIYWNYGDYIGAGPGAHGRVWANGQRIATLCEKAPEDYLSAIEKSGTGAAFIEMLDGEAQLAERIMMGLRLKTGIALRSGDDFFSSAARVMRMNALIDDGFLAFEKETLRATRKGARVLNTVLYKLLA